MLPKSFFLPKPFTEPKERNGKVYICDKSDCCNNLDCKYHTENVPPDTSVDMLHTVSYLRLRDCKLLEDI